MLNEKEMNLFKEKLEIRRAKIEANLSISVDASDALRNNELKDEADHAVVSLENSIEHAIFGQQSKELAEIELALDRIKEKNYGICEMCSSEINIERLKVKIFARYCITCREVVEKVY